LTILKASTPVELENAFATVVGQRIGALLASADPLFFEQGAQLAALATRHAVPAIYHAREIVHVGGLMSYGASISDAYRLAGAYTGRILKAENKLNTSQASYFNSLIFDHRPMSNVWTIYVHRLLPTRMGQFTTPEQRIDPGTAERTAREEGLRRRGRSGGRAAEDLI
jgi:hypothetical protein